MRFKVQVAERARGRDLCQTCRHALIQRGDTLDDHRVYCKALSGDINGPLRVKPGIVQCSGYEDKRYAELWEMKQIAWRLQTDKGRQIGFVPPKHTRKDMEGKEVEVVYDPVTKVRVDLDD